MHRPRKLSTNHGHEGSVARSPCCATSLRPNAVTDTHDPLHHPVSKPLPAVDERGRQTLQIGSYLGLGTVAIGQKLLLVVKQLLTGFGREFLVLRCKSASAPAIMG